MKVLPLEGAGLKVQEISLRKSHHDGHEFLKLGAAIHIQVGDYKRLPE